jgi:hypothetical protein
MPVVTGAHKSLARDHKFFSSKPDNRPEHRIAVITPLTKGTGGINQRASIEGSAEFVTGTESLTTKARSDGIEKECSTISRITHLGDDGAAAVRVRPARANEPIWPGINPLGGVMAPLELKKSLAKKSPIWPIFWHS